MYRKFAEAAPDHPTAKEAIHFIRQFYDIDREADKDGVTDMKKRAELRNTRSRVVMANMNTWLRDLEVLTSTSFGVAARYAFDNWGCFLSPDFGAPTLRRVNTG